MSRPLALPSSPIRALLGDPQVRRLFATSLLGRLPTGVVGLVLVLHGRELTGSYAAGGLAAGAWTLAFGLTAPALGRAVDRRGQPAVLLPCALVCGSALVTLALLPARPPLAALLVLSALAGGATPPLGACLRAIWAPLLVDRDRIHAAFALESVIIELSYVAGPLLIAGAIASRSPAAALLTCAGLGLAGTIAFAATGASRSARGERGAEPAAGRRGGALRAPAVRVVLLAFVCVALTLAGAAAAAGAAVLGREALRP